jgi:hypothetical protein
MVIQQSELEDLAKSDGLAISQDAALVQVRPATASTFTMGDTTYSCAYA